MSDSTRRSARGRASADPTYPTRSRAAPNEAPRLKADSIAEKYDAASSSTRKRNRQLFQHFDYDEESDEEREQGRDGRLKRANTRRDQLAPPTDDPQPELSHASSLRARLHNAFHLAASKRSHETPAALNSEGDELAYRGRLPGPDAAHFSADEFQQCVEQLDIAPVAALSRTEWCFVRGQMGKPRRLSQIYLVEERDKQQQRATRTKDEVESAHLQIGQDVLTFIGGELHHGKVVSLPESSNARYGVQHADASRPVFLPDNLVMALPPLLETAIPIAGANSTTNGKHSTRPVDSKLRITEQEKPTRAISLPRVVQPPPSRVNESATEREARLALISQVMWLLDRKELLLKALTEMNQEAEVATQQGSPSALSAHFRQQYAWVIVQLNQINQSLESTLKQAGQSSLAPTGPSPATMYKQAQDVAHAVLRETQRKLVVTQQLTASEGALLLESGPLVDLVCGSLSVLSTLQQVSENLGDRPEHVTTACTALDDAVRALQTKLSSQGPVTPVEYSVAAIKHLLCS